MTDTIKISRELRPVLSITDEQLAEIDRAANGACQYSQDDWFSFHDFLAFYASDDAEFLSAASPWVVIALITRLRAAENKLRALEPIAADMGGQAGEDQGEVQRLREALEHCSEVMKDPWKHGEGCISRAINRADAALSASTGQDEGEQ